MDTPTRTKRDRDHDQAPLQDTHKRRRLVGDDGSGNSSEVPEDTPRRLSNHNYVVGWICALHTEYVAAREFLDERHDGPEGVSPNDNNSYTLGRIGKHNVVIAVLPFGEYGTDPAASVATHMLHSFPNVRIGLTVGIGGGAPTTKHDIRLGDVVVSAPCKNHGGVFQYDYGKTIQDQAFRATRFLNQVPTVLRTALNDLKAIYEADGHTLHESVSAILRKKPRLAKTFQRPGADQDRLFRADVVHPPDDDRSCAEACGNDTSRLVVRSDREPHEDNPAIHYGLIASANQVMKDAVLRDRLAKEEEVLCFEMEAAGLVNHFPCLVIRGICDYADSHKSKEWQGYAAMTAAAYTKDLLSRIRPTRVENEKRIYDLLVEATQVTKELATETRDNIRHIISDKRSDDMHRWLSPSNPSANYTRALHLRHKDSGRWLLDSENSAIIEELHRTSSHSQTLLYFYFDFSDTAKQSLENMARSLLCQLYYQTPGVQNLLDSLYSSNNNGKSQPRVDSLCSTLREMIDSADNVRIVLDALDECSTRKELLDWIRSLHDMNSHMCLLTTSRPEQDIESKIRDWARAADIVPLQSGLVREDICQFIHARVHNDNALSRWQGKPTVQEEIESALRDKADGMFRWVTCQLDALENCLDYRALQKALRTLPRTLDETYVRILENIPPDHLPYTKRILQFLTFSERPLRIDEAVDAIAVSLTETPRFDASNRMPIPTEISRYCSSLVAVVEKEDDAGDMTTEIQLSHYSVKEWLISNRLDPNLSEEFREPNARAVLAQICIAYLLDLSHDLPVREITRLFPFAKYTARFWAYHAVVGETATSAVTAMAMELFNSQVAYRGTYKLYDPDEVWSEENERRRSKPPLYFAAYHGLYQAARQLLNKDTDVNAQGGYYGSALQTASVRGYGKIIRLLLDEGADVNAQGGYYGNALQAASVKGDDKIIRLLLDEGADVNAQGGLFNNALQAASIKKFNKIVKLLLDKGADVNARGGYYGNALQATVIRGYDEIVQLLLDGGADVNARGGYYANALQAALATGHDKIVRLLLNGGAKVS
ncbi:hypothetical protein DL769_002152 [Monosporascus sp. CRB-8-3]|nr:hypothetical protein DL769_002152 [Monosporascus sp. CRB-8-3]